MQFILRDSNSGFHQVYNNTVSAALWMFTSTYCTLGSFTAAVLVINVSYNKWK